MKGEKAPSKITIPVTRVFVKNNTVYICNQDKIIKPIQLTWSPVTL